MAYQSSYRQAAEREREQAAELEAKAAQDEATAAQEEADQKIQEIRSEAQQKTDASNGTNYGTTGSGVLDQLLGR